MSGINLRQVRSQVTLHEVLDLLGFAARHSHRYLSSE